MNYDVTDRFEKFVNMISLIQKNILKIKSIEMKEFGLKGPHVMCLFYLGRYEEGLTAAELCRMISVDKAAVSRVLSELQQNGYILYPDNVQRKKYRANVVLTSEGKQITEKVNNIINSIVEKIGIDISDEERGIMYGSLQKILSNLEELARESSSYEYTI